MEGMVALSMVAPDMPPLVARLEKAAGRAAARSGRADRRAPVLPRSASPHLPVPLPLSPQAFREDRAGDRGATGIGRATVLALAREGAAVAVNYSKSKAAADETARLAEQAGVRALPVQADITRDAEVRAMADLVARELGGLDCLVNNAGWTQRVPHRRFEDAHRRDLGPGARHQPARRLLLRARRGAPHGAAGRGGHRQHHLGGDVHRHRLVHGLRGVQGGARRAHEVAGPRAGAFAHPGQRGGPGPARHRLRRRPHHARICSPRSGASRRSAGPPPWRKSRRRWCSCSPTRP